VSFEAPRALIYMRAHSDHRNTEPLLGHLELMCDELLILNRVSAELSADPAYSKVSGGAAIISERCSCFDKKYFHLLATSVDDNAVVDPSTEQWHLEHC
jgi:hypothetical protein